MLEFRLSTLAVPQAARRLAKAAVAVLADALCAPDVVHDFDLALTEACANVVRHAYPPGEPGPVGIVLWLHPGESVQAMVTDQGKGPPPDAERDITPGPDSEGGRGLFIIKSLMDEATLVRREGSTEVFMRKNVPGELWNSGQCRSGQAGGQTGGQTAGR